MKKIAKIEIGKKKYTIDLNKFYDLSIPIDINKKSPSFYDEKPIIIKYYKDQDNKIWSTKDGAPCNIPIIDLNIHCGTTHSECRSHITKESLTISEVIKDFFIPSILLSVEPQDTINNETYHCNFNNKDSIITERLLKKHLELYKGKSIKAIIIRTLPNIENEVLSKDYNKEHNPFFSNEAILYIKSLGIEHLIVDIPSIDRFDDGGNLGNHQIFWGLTDIPNNNTITELAFISNEIKDGFYILSLNVSNINLDASPCRPIIYPILK
tara:strand:+ start:124 stop:924 length:801 start_codon:yes stop_codon:yes gene_type:complete